MPKQRRRQEEKALSNESLVASQSSPSLLSVQRTEDFEQERSQAMVNPKQQLQKANSYGFNFGNIPMYPPGQSGQRGAFAPIQAKLENQEAPRQDGLAQTVIQAQKDPAVVQRAASPAQVVKYARASQSLGPIGSWINGLKDTVSCYKPLGIVSITKPIKFEIISFFAEKEWSDDATNALWLMSKMNRMDPLSVLAVAEQFRVNGKTKYKSHLPMTSFLTKQEPKGLNVASEVTRDLELHFKQLEEALSFKPQSKSNASADQSSDAPAEPDWNNLPTRGRSDATVEDPNQVLSAARLRLMATLGELAQSQILLLGDTMQRIILETYDSLFPGFQEALSYVNVEEALTQDSVTDQVKSGKRKKLWGTGGFRKAQILSNGRRKAGLRR